MSKNNKVKSNASPKLSPNQLVDQPVSEIMQGSQYNNHCQAAPLNDIFFEEKSNPLSSRGN